MSDAKVSPAELYMEELPSPVLPYKPFIPMVSWVMTFSPCSRFFLRCGRNSPFPTDVDQWTLLPHQGAFKYNVVSQGVQLEGKRPIVAWYPSGPSSGVYALLLDGTHVQIMSCPKARQLASWGTFEQKPQGIDHRLNMLSWSPDGQSLACQGPERLALFRFHVKDL